MSGTFGLAAALLATAVSFASPAFCEPPAPAPPDEGNEVEQVVVTAQRIGAPVWRVTQGDATLILVADADVPRGGTWRPEALEAVVRDARSMFVPKLSTGGKVVLQREGTPREAVAVDTQLEARLQRVAESLRIRRVQTRNLRVLGQYVIARVLGPDRRKEDGFSLATRAARKHRVRQVSFRGFEAMAAPETLEAASAREVRCAGSAVELAEHARDDSAHRLVAWRRNDVHALTASRLEAAARDCSALAGPRYQLAQPAIEAALRGTLNEPGVTVAVLPLWSLADPGKLLDQLSRDLPVRGPRWRN